MNEEHSDPHCLDMTFVQDDELEQEHDEESSDEFNFNDVIVCKKNLSVTFDQYVQSNTTPFHSTKINSTKINTTKINTTKINTTKINTTNSNTTDTINTTKNNNTTDNCQTNSNITDTIINNNNDNMHGEAIQSIEHKITKKLSVSLRIRPSTDSTVEIQSNNNHNDNNYNSDLLQPQSMSVRTYPPIDSQTLKSSRGGTAGVKEFPFAAIWGPDASQEHVYTQMVTPLLSKLLSGNDSSALLFCYGSTNAGKTYTMMGNLIHPNQWGMLPRTMQELCELPQTTILMSYLEIYNEQIFDLLPLHSATARSIIPLKLITAGTHHAVAGLAKHPVTTVQMGLDLTRQAQAKRHTSNNNVNAESSRSHTICQFEIVSNDNNNSINKTFWMVDLAGSERSKRTGMINSIRQREATLINASLMKLMRCLLPDSDVIPYRESKLTHLFMHHLISGGSTSMMVNINPAAADFDETQHVLAYAVAAKIVPINVDEYLKKRNAMGAEGMVTHGLDGRPLKRPATAECNDPPQSKIAKLISKFSPKKSLMRINKNIHMNKKRKVEESISKVEEPVKSRGFGRLPEEQLMSLQPKVNRWQPQSRSNPIKKKSDPEKQLQLLKTQLSIAQAETEVLKNEQKHLQVELQDVESQVRMEAAEEMQVQLQAMRDEYNTMYAKLERKTQPTPSRSTKKAQMDKAQEMMEDLMEKVEECEEEMKRMREEHNEELARVKDQYEGLVTTLSTELQHLKREHLITVTAMEKAKDDEERDWNERIQELEAELDRMQQDKLEEEDARKEQYQALQEELEQTRLLKLAEEIVMKEQPKKLKDQLEQGQQGKVICHELTIQEDKLWSENVSPKQQSVVTVPISQMEKPNSQGSENTISNIVVEKRPPFGDLGNSCQDSALFFPKKPAALDESAGIYKRPSGRAPTGRDWDERKGAWRLSVCD